MNDAYNCIGQFVIESKDLGFLCIYFSFKSYLYERVIVLVEVIY